MQETVTVGVDGTVLERIAKIMAYLRLGSSGKVSISLSCSWDVLMLFTWPWKLLLRSWMCRGSSCFLLLGLNVF